MTVTVQVPDDVASELVTAGLANAARPDAAASMGGFAEVAEVAAVVAGQAATFVTLASGADVFAGVAARIRRLHGGRGRWLQARGPGGEVSLKLTHAMSEDALATLLRTLWETKPSDDSGSESGSGSV